MPPRDGGASPLLSPGLLFYPQAPRPEAVITRICARLGYRIVADPADPFDVAIFWTTSTVRRRDPILGDLTRRSRVLNMECGNIGKRRVDRVFRSVFGYGSLVDPLSGSGSCVRKSNRNATHDGLVLQRPLSVRDRRCVYQRLINNAAGEGGFEDLRTPVIGGQIPFAYIVRKPPASRFEDVDAVRLTRADELFSPTEVLLILRFCRGMGLDYAELDILRDRDDGRLYIVDANPTPWLLDRLVEQDVETAVERMAAAFGRLVQPGDGGCGDQRPVVRALAVSGAPYDL